MPRVVLLAIVLSVLVAACTSSTTEPVGADAFVTGRGTEQVPPAERVAAPAVDGQTLDGQPLALADLDGPVVVNFWASWCGPCIQEAPDLVAVHERYGGQGVHLLGVNVLDSLANARRFESDLGIPYPSLVDDTGAIAHAFGGVGPGAMPSTIILDAEHRVAARFIGLVTLPILADHLDRLLADAGEAAG